MMGTADELPQAPAEKVVFLEDMTDAELATAVCIAEYIVLMTGIFRHEALTIVI